MDESYFKVTADELRCKSELKADPTRSDRLKKRQAQVDEAGDSVSKMDVDEEEMDEDDNDSIGTTDLSVTDESSDSDEEESDEEESDEEEIEDNTCGLKCMLYIFAMIFLGFGQTLKPRIIWVFRFGFRIQTQTRKNNIFETQKHKIFEIFIICVL